MPLCGPCTMRTSCRAWSTAAEARCMIAGRLPGSRAGASSARGDAVNHGPTLVIELAAIWRCPTPPISRHASRQRPGCFSSHGQAAHPPHWPGAHLLWVRCAPRPWIRSALALVMLHARHLEQKDACQHCPYACIPGAHAALSCGLSPWAALLRPPTTASRTTTAPTAAARINWNGCVLR